MAQAGSVPARQHGVEQTLRKSEERFRQVVESAPNAMIMVNASGRIEMVNMQAERDFGYTRAELLGQPVEILVPGRFRARHPALRDAFFPDPHARPMGAGRDLYGLRKDGSEFPIEIGLNPIETDEGTMVLSAIVDITARKHLEERFRRVVESAPNAIIMISESGRIEMVNAQAERVFGYSRSELLGQQMEMLVPNRFRQRHPALRDAFFAEPGARPMGAGRDLYALRKDGTEFPVEIGLNPIETEEGVMVLSAIVEITERRESEAERQRAEKRVQDLQSELLHVSRLSTMGQMASTLAHELNQPLTAVTNYLQGLRRLIQTGTADRARAIDVIDRAVEQAARAGQVIRRLREFVTKGETDRRFEDLNRVIEEAAALAFVGAKQHAVEISMQLDRNCPGVFIDKIQVQQVILNLIRNAIEAMEQSDRRELSITTSLCQSGKEIEIRVTDTGPGLVREVAERLFEPFLTTKKTGMGLGLSICREIVEAQGGRISAAPNTSSGTIFSVIFPVAHDEEQEHGR